MLHPGMTVKDAYQAGKDEAPYWDAPKAQILDVSRSLNNTSKETNRMVRAYWLGVARMKGGK